MLSKTSLRILYQLSIGQGSLKEIAKSIKKSDKQVYRECKKLKNVGYIDLERGEVFPERLPHVNLLLQTLREHDNVIDLFSGSGIIVLVSLIEQKSIENIIEETQLKQSIIYRKIKQAESIGLVIKKEGYVLNEKLWPKAAMLFQELSRLNRFVDNRVPANSEIFYKSKEEIIFSNVTDINATKTAFSAYEGYGIKLYLLTNYYHLPTKNLTKKDILSHSIYIAEKSGIREKIFTTLFYIKFKKETNLKHPMLENIDKILKGEKIPDYPKLSEIKSRCDVYDIEI
jgi:predicted transcriptional regulator